MSKIIVVVLTILVVNLGVFGSIGTNERTNDLAKIKREVAKIGTGPDAKIDVKLKDGTKLKGYVSEIGNEHFIITDLKTGKETSVPYPQVKTAKAHRGWILFAAGAAAVIIIGIVVAKGSK